MNKKTILALTLLLSALPYTALHAMRCAPSPKLKASFLKLIEKGDLAGVRQELQAAQKRDQKVNLDEGIYDAKEQLFKLPLEIAIKSNNYKIAEFLLIQGASPNTLCSDYWSMLGATLAYLNDNPADTQKMVWLLLMYQADPNQPTQESPYSGWGGGGCNQSTPLEQALLHTKSASVKGDNNKNAQCFQAIARHLISKNAQLPANSSPQLLEYLDKDFGAHTGIEETKKAEDCLWYGDHDDADERATFLPAQPKASSCLIQ